jgi:hypothetical protein
VFSIKLDDCNATWYVCHVTLPCSNTLSTPSSYFMEVATLADSAVTWCLPPLCLRLCDRGSVSGGTVLPRWLCLVLGLHRGLRVRRWLHVADVDHMRGRLLQRCWRQQQLPVSGRTRVWLCGHGDAVKVSP